MMATTALENAEKYSGMLMTLMVGGESQTAMENAEKVLGAKKTIDDALSRMRRQRWQRSKQRRKEPMKLQRLSLTRRSQMVKMYIATIEGYLKEGGDTGRI